MCLLVPHFLDMRWFTREKLSTLSCFNQRALIFTSMVVFIIILFVSLYDIVVALILYRS
jgi:hypothetical protein